jgi:hypothetical protein
MRVVALRAVGAAVGVVARPGAPAFSVVIAGFGSVGRAARGQIPRVAPLDCSGATRCRRRYCSPRRKLCRRATTSLRRKGNALPVVTRDTSGSGTTSTGSSGTTGIGSATTSTTAGARETKHATAPTDERGQTPAAAVPPEHDRPIRALRDEQHRAPISAAGHRPRPLPRPPSADRTLRSLPHWRGETLHPVPACQPLPVGLDKNASIAIPEQALAPLTRTRRHNRLKRSGGKRLALSRIRPKAITKSSKGDAPGKIQILRRCRSLVETDPRQLACTRKASLGPAGPGFTIKRFHDSTQLSRTGQVERAS